MYKLAILHQVLGEQLPASPTLSNAELLFIDTDLSDFLNHLAYHRPNVLVIDLALLGNYPIRTLQELKRGCSAECIMVSYVSARWNIIEQLQAEGVRLINAPLSVNSLQSHLDDFATRPAHIPISHVNQANVMYFGQPPRQGIAQQFLQNFNMTEASNQLMPLTEPDPSTATQSRCECIHHLADIVMSLAEFEKYTQTCVKKMPGDAEIHEILRQEARKARALMENALAKLSEHEKQNFSQPRSVSA